MTRPPAPVAQPEGETPPALRLMRRRRKVFAKLTAAPQSAWDLMHGNLSAVFLGAIERDCTALVRLGLAVRSGERWCPKWARLA